MSTRPLAVRARSVAVPVALGLAAWLLPVAAFGQQPAKPAAAQPAAKAAAPAAKAAAGKATAAGFKSVVEPRALDLLKAAGARLAAAKSLAFTAVSSYEYPSKLGPPIVYSTRYDVTLVRPDKLRVLMPGDGPASEFYYDGKSIVAYAPADNLAAVADAPPTIDAMLKAAFDSAAIFFPFTDLLVSDPYKALSEGVKTAFVVGPSTVVGGTKTDMVVWANDDVFMQIWIGADDKLPRRIRGIYRADPLRLRHDLELTNWQVDGPVAAEAFASAKAQSAGRMAFAKPVPPPKGVRPLGTGKAAPAKAPAKSN